MAMDIYDAVNEDGLFNILGRAFRALESLNTARLTSVPDDVAGFLAQFKLFADSASLPWVPTVEGVPGSLISWQSGAVLSQQLAAACQAILLQWANDAGLPRATVQTALDWLIDEMEAAGWYVDGNTIGFTLTPDAGNQGDVAICYTAARGDGLTQENTYAETISVTCTGGGVNATLKFAGEVAQADLMREDWPLGSASAVSIVSTSPASSLLANGDFEDETTADIPDNWIVRTGTPGTTVLVTAPEVQTVTIGGTPTGGSYLLFWTNGSAVKRSTSTLAYNASGSAVQAALRAIPGLEQVTVSTTGTTPNFTHEITFTGTPGNPSQLTSVSALTGGSPTITHATTTAGSGGFLGKALAIVGNGSQLTALYHPLTLEANKVYFCHLRALAESGLAAGEVKIELVDGIDGNVIDDAAGNANAYTLDPTGISTTAHESKFFAFRLPPETTWPVYLRIRLSTAISNGKTLWLDEVAITPGVQLYAGGPYIAAVSGRLTNATTDTWELAVANNRAGTLQEWFNRVFGTGRLERLLPVAGTDLIPDGVVAATTTTTTTTTTAAP